MKYGLIYSANNYESSVNVIHCATAKEDKQQLMSFATQFREVFFLVITTAHALQGNSRDLPGGYAEGVQGTYWRGD